MNFSFPLGLALLALVRVAAAPSETDWPNWRGPHFDGSSSATGLPTDFSAAKATWTSPLPGPAGSTPITWGGRIFLTAPDASKNLNLLCLDQASGKALWSQSVAVGDKEKGRNNLAAPSPVTDGERVIALFGTGDLAAFDFDGKLLWQRQLYKDYGRFAIMWLYGSSPLLYDGTLYLQVLQRDEMPGDYPFFDGKPARESFLLGLDPATGKTRWKVGRKTDSTKESNESYATPLPWKRPSGTELVIVGGDHISGHSLADGTEIWRARLYEKRDDWYRIVTSPVAVGDFVLGSGPKGQPVVAYKSGGHGDVTTTHRVWDFKEAPTDWSTPLFFHDRVYVLDGGRRVLSRIEPKGGAMDWTGKIDVQDSIWGSPTGADGRIFLLSEEGNLIVCEAAPAFKQLAKVALSEGPCRSSVVVSGKSVLVRTARQLFKFGTE